MNLSPEVVEEVLYEFKRVRSPFKVARLLGLSSEQVFEVVEENADRLSPHQEQFGGKGRPELQQFTVARRHVSSRSWDNDAEPIAQARAAYEAGTVEMCTGRDGNWLILYAVPRRKIAPRPNYFQPEF